MTWDEVKKARRRLSREQDIITKDWGGKIPVALIYPNSYYLGMSNLGLHAIYKLLNSYDKVVCERAFWEKDTKQILSLESPTFFSLVLLVILTVRNLIIAEYRTADT